MGWHISWSTILFFKGEGDPYATLIRITQEYLFTNMAYFALLQDPVNQNHYSYKFQEPVFLAIFSRVSCSESQTCSSLRVTSSLLAPAVLWPSGFCYIFFIKATDYTFALSLLQRSLVMWLKHETKRSCSNLLLNVFKSNKISYVRTLLSNSDRFSTYVSLNLIFSLILQTKNKNYLL